MERPGGLYVSRGGQKLKLAIDRFGISLAGRTAADLGASTGGFTDCMLKEGAAKVYAVDVGYGQLDYALRKDPRVTVMEKTNVRALTRAHFPDAVDFFTADLSFISIVKAFDAVRDAFSPAEGVILIKPQFEAGPGDHKKGVVRKPEAHRGDPGPRARRPGGKGDDPERAHAFADTRAQGEYRVPGPLLGRGERAGRRAGRARPARRRCRG